MTRAAPRISPRLVDVMRRVDDGKMPIAELARRVGAAAEQLSLPRPSYEQIRVHAHTARRWAAINATTGEVLLDVAFRARPAEDVHDHLAGTLRPKRR